MSRLEPKNLAASVKARLRALADKRREVFDTTLVRYAGERLLYRLSMSKWRDRFVLKGAMLFAAWADKPYRPTRDVDLLGRLAADAETVGRVFRDICGVEVAADGLEFDAESVRVEQTQADEEYGGFRVMMQVLLGKAKVDLQVDIGVGDAVTPKPERIDYPTMLDFPQPRLLAYPVSTFIAEKFEAMVEKGIVNGRLRDYYDLWVLAATRELDGSKLCAAVKATFDRRATPLPVETPDGLSDEYAADASHARQWRELPVAVEIQRPPLPEVLEKLRRFLLPVSAAAAQGAPFARVWFPSSGWRKPDAARVRFDI